MNLVKILDNHTTEVSQKCFYLLGDRSDGLVFHGFDVADSHHDNEGSYLCLFDKDNTSIKSQSVLLTADTTADELDLLIKNHLLEIKSVYFYVADFKDGRVFSLIKYLRNQGYDKQNAIYVCGEFGLDQANYFVKSGANGFVVSDDKVATLKHTLTDLQTGHFGQSANSLPMFR